MFIPVFSTVPLLTHPYRTVPDILILIYYISLSVPYGTQNLHIIRKIWWVLVSYGKNMIHPPLCYFT